MEARRQRSARTLTGTARLAGLSALAGLATLLACSPDSRSPSAQPEITEMLRADLEAERHPADGGGRASITAESLAPPAPPTAGRPGRWTLIYEAGPHGIAEGGWLYLQAPPFWGWSSPQVVAPDAPGFTTIETDAGGVRLAPVALDEQLLGIRIGGRALAAGERVTMVYGAGPAGAIADRYAERSRFYLAVDGDGDGVRALVDPAGSPLEVEIAPGPPARLLLTLPSSARPGESPRLTVAVVDEVGNAGVDFAGEIALSGLGAGLEGPPTVRLREEDRGRVEVRLSAAAEGVYRLGAAGPGGLAAESNPLVVGGDRLRVLWGDLHGHSGLSDGTGSPRDYFAYAREVAGLDLVALTDHDHWGMEPLALHPELWEEIRRETGRFHEPGRFVTLLGFEWTSWVQGHRHVLYFDEPGEPHEPERAVEVLSSLDRRYDTPPELWRALRGRPALTFAHHSAGGPVATNWDYPPDPVLEPVTEIVSVHGASEAPDAPWPIYSAVPGNYVRDALDRGYALGFIGSGDGHDGHPGLAHLAAGSGGLAAILAEELTREAVLDALRARRVYATNGPRIVLRLSLAGRRMGSELPPAASAELRGVAIAPAPLARIEVVRSGAVTWAHDCEGRRSCSFAAGLSELSRGEYVYVRALQADGGAAWSSPFFVR